MEGDCTYVHFLQVIDLFDQEYRKLTGVNWRHRAIDEYFLNQLFPGTSAHESCIRLLPSPSTNVGSL